MRLTTDDLERIKVLCDGNILILGLEARDPRTGYAALAERMRPVVEAWAQYGKHLDTYLQPEGRLARDEVRAIIASVKRAVVGT